jgi:hypothetical protein
VNALFHQSDTDFRVSRGWSTNDRRSWLQFLYHLIDVVVRWCIDHRGNFASGFDSNVSDTDEFAWQTLHECLSVRSRNSASPDDHKSWFDTINHGWPLVLK